VIIGVSPDSVASHEKFSGKHGLNFLLLSDADREVANAYGVIKEKTVSGKKRFGIQRSTFVLDESGKIHKIFRNVQVKGHAEEVLALL
jgi:peroxiredoxin Q/BCP